MTATTDIAIETTGLGKSFGGVRAVDAIDLRVPSGTVFALLGPNGAGKTTIVRMLATQLRPDRGSARIFGYDVATDATAVRSMIGLTGQYASVDESLSATENLQIFGRLLGLSRRAANARAAELIEQFQLTAAQNRPARTLSGGTRRRLDLAASLIIPPPLLFLDEPTTGLDPHTRMRMWDTIRALVAEGVTVLLTTQYLEEADMLSDRIAVIDNGTVVAEGSADDLKAAVGEDVLRLDLLDQAGVQTAVLIAERLAGNAVRISPEGATISVPLRDVDTATVVLTELRRAGIGLRGFGVDRPELNEVFLTLTNRAQAPHGAPV
ncbi:ATP-binding cassette domain-containing protein [Nocardia brasiliensis]